jgi:hypothetical protein
MREGAKKVRNLTRGDREVAMATYRAACQRGSNAAITLRQGARVIEDSRRLRLV